jgi:hypothetical protein
MVATYLEFAARIEYASAAACLHGSHKIKNNHTQHLSLRRRPAPWRSHPRETEKTPSFFSTGRLPPRADGPQQDCSA